MALTKIDDRGLKTPVDLLDNEKIRFGTGNDLEIYHSGSDSRIVDGGTGSLYIGGSKVELTNVGISELMLSAVQDAQVELYYDGAKKFHTTSTGVTVTGGIYATGELNLIDGSTNAARFIDAGLGDGNALTIRGTSGGDANHETLAKFTRNGASELYHDNSLTLKTDQYGIIVTAPTTSNASTVLIKGFEAKDAQLLLQADEADDGPDTHKILGSTDGSFYIQNLSNGSSYETNIKTTGAGNVELYYDNTLKFETTANGIEVEGSGTDAVIANFKAALGSNNRHLAIKSPASDSTTLPFLISTSNSIGFEVDNVECLRVGSADDVSLPNDTSKLNFGASADLSIYHDGTDDVIHSTGTSLRTRSNIFRANNAANSAVMFRSFADGAFEANYNGSKKFETTSTGVTLSGKMVSDVGSAGEYILEVKGTSTKQFGFYYDQASWEESIFRIDEFNNSGTAKKRIAIESKAVYLYYDDVKKLETTSDGVKVTGQLHPYADLAGSYAVWTKNDGNNSNRYGMYVSCGTDDASGTNYPLWFADGNGDDQGGFTFNNGTVSLVAFTAAHPAEVPDSDNPSDTSPAYPYGTLVETTAITYSKKSDGSDTERGIIYKVQKTQSANSRKILGAYSGNMRGGPAGRTNDHEITVVGDGHILCNNAGGNIEVGDGICSSATAGIGQKATVNPSMIIGIAQEDVTFTGSETKLVPVQFGLQQFIPWT